jgi:signal transduction histidine kinase
MQPLTGAATDKEPGMDARNLVTALGLVAACSGVVWLRTGFARPPKTPRGRAAEVGWCVALLIIVLTLTATQQQVISGRYPTTFAIPLAAAVLLVLQPRLAFGLVPAGLILLGVLGLVVAREYGFWGYIFGHYLFLPLGDYNIQYYLVLPLAYGLIGLGGWLGWRVLDRQAPLIRLLLGPLSDPGRPGRLWGFLLLPVVIMAAELLIPSIWLGAGVAGMAASLALVASTFWFIRRDPERAAGVATGGLIALGVAGLEVAGSWASWPLPKAVNEYVLDGVVAVSSQPLASVAVAQSVVFIGFGLWLVPRTIPQARQLLGWASDADLVRRVQRLTESRAVAVDTAAADLRRLERDLHDGAQARLVALGMNLRAIERLIPTSPDAAVALVIEARETSVRALTELRELVRGVHPPVLADRGLGDAIRALALDTPMKIETDIDLPSRLAAPIETACYFAVAEVLTNAVKHSGAREARIAAAHSEGMLRIAVTDFGTGGADPARGSGLAGVEKRLATFDGIVAVSSPVGGPTMIVMEVPCASSSQRISSC